MKKKFVKAPSTEHVERNALTMSAPSEKQIDTGETAPDKQYFNDFHEKQPVETTKDDEMTCVSTMECTGSIPARPATEYEYASYQELNRFSPPNPIEKNKK